MTTTTCAAKAASAAETAGKKPEREPMKFVEQIGSTEFQISVRFSATSKESLEDKILRMIEREAMANAS